MKPAEIHHKKWGYEEWIANTPLYCGKRLILNKGWRCSMHHHKVKDETFFIDSGLVLIEWSTPDRTNVRSFVLSSGDTFRVQPGEWHRFTGLTDAVIFEVSTHHEDDDSYRDEPSGRAPAAVMDMAQY